MAGVQISQNEFSVVDYVVFSLFLGISAGVGFFFACYGGKQKTTKEFLMGNRSMQLIPVSISILVSFTSAILILGSPAELYLNGTIYLYYPIGMAVACVLSAVIFVPLFYPLKLTSAFEYLEKRFESKAVRVVGNLLYVLKGIVYMGIAMYAPATAMESVTNGKFNKFLAISLSGVVGTLYTMLGGMKAVVWTDVFQGGVMLVGVVTILIQATVLSGGVDQVWYWAGRYDRLIWSEWSFDPTERHTMWGLIIGSAIGWMGTFGTNQASVQRFCSLPTMRKAQWSIFLNIPGSLILAWCSCLAGLAIFAYYISQGCDIYKIGWAEKNQIVPYFVMDKLNIPGIPGIFIAALFSGALSSISSSLNACSAITWKDILQPFCCKNLSDRMATILNKVLVVLFGILGTIMGVVATNLGGTVLQASLSFSGAIGGPSLGLFLLGAFFPHANWIGGVVGPLVGVFLTLWVSIGAYSVRKQDVELGSNISMCITNSSISSFYRGHAPVPIATESTLSSGLDTFYSISYLWYPAIGTFVTIIVGLLVSLPFEIRKRSHVNPKYLFPVFHRFCCCCPAKCRKTVSCGYTEEEMLNFDDEEDEVDEEIIIDKNGGIEIKLKEPIAGNKVQPLNEVDSCAEQETKSLGDDLEKTGDETDGDLGTARERRQSSYM